MPVEINSVAVKDSDAKTWADGAYTYARTTDRTRLDHLTKVGLRNTLRSWIASKPWSFPKGTKLGSFETTFGMTNTAPKAYWKAFDSKGEFYQHLMHEADARCQRKRELEQELAEDVLEHARTGQALNELRRALGKHLWDHDSWAGTISHVLTANPIVNLLPNMTGSYNEANSYPAYARRPWEKLGGNFNPLNLVMNLTAQPLYDYSMRSKDRVSLSYDKRDFTVAENVAILHDLKELFSPIKNSRAFITMHKELVPNPYQGATSPARPRRWTTDGAARANVLKKDLTRYVGNPHEERRPVSWDQGRKGAGTRNEDSPDTETAREHHMPIETGRSHTAARLFEMVALLRPANGASADAIRTFEGWMKAMAFGIFGYWNADQSVGGYPKSLTPVHTYHEVMDPAEDYLMDIYAHPFTYDDVIAYLRT
ncbi:hypothetical protein D7Y21_23940 [Corallococcus sp. AB045]|uniref:hypothetical protein n=1 Tax=Corallococcus sp. AB045 TaxID=2316719 RepID=UPI000EE46E08|nr:hypothetical protein [Corallococcus sp. AB045]RKH84878.1 hypothetical protein D7Y21_23940 [Corallococcus sp. AB045]